MSNYNLDKLKTEYDKSKEKELLQEMLEVVEKREQLITDMEDTKKRYRKLFYLMYSCLRSLGQCYLT